MNCENPTDNPKFCSSSCSATYNNKIFPKRKRKTYHCKVCGIIVTRRRTVCDDHSKSKIKWSELTLKNILYDKGRKQDRYCRIREHSRKLYMNSKRPKQCENCGYKYHFQVCHIKPIYKFDINTTLSIVNNLSNLIALCPNCHWELDNGLLRLD